MSLSLFVQIPRSMLKKRGVAEFLFNAFRGVWICDKTLRETQRNQYHDGDFIPRSRIIKSKALY